MEVCRSGKWGMIRGGSGSWDSREGQVVCRQLGFQNPGNYFIILETIYIDLF